MFAIDLAGHCIGVENRYHRLERVCSGYISSGEPEVVVRASDEDIENMRSKLTGGYSPISECEVRAVHGKVCDYLLERDVMGFHASAFAFDGHGILITAPSGTGKSTHSRLWRERFGDRVKMINDDKPFLSFKSKDRIDVLGSPWCGKEWIQNNDSAPLRCIVIIHQAPENTIRRITQSTEYFSQLLKESYIPAKDYRGLVKSTTLVARLCTLPIYSLGCTISQEAVDLCHGALLESIAENGLL